MIHKNSTRLRALGFSSFFQTLFSQISSSGLKPARVAVEYVNRYEVLGEFGECSAELSGKLRYSGETLPAVGDWVAVQHLDGIAIIHHVLPRRTKFSRKEAGTLTDEQIVAANVDTVFIVTGLDENYNLRRIERYLTLAYESGAEPVIVLNKADVLADPSSVLEEVGQIAMNAAMILTSTLTGDGIDRLRAYLQEGQTVALLGSSGVGKSSLSNTILGEAIMHVNAVSDSNAKGRHTTTHRQLLVAPTGGMLIDTPGMRELQLWTAEDGLSETFADVEAIAPQCRFTDCQHDGQPGCAVQVALDTGELDPGRWKSYQKLERELHHLAIKQDIQAMRKEKEQWKKLTKSIRVIKRDL